MSSSLRRRRKSDSPSPCNPLPLPQPLDLSSSIEALASLRFLVLSYLAELETNLVEAIDDNGDGEGEEGEEEEWDAEKVLEMLKSIREDVCSQLPDFKVHLPDFPFDASTFRQHLDSMKLSFDDMKHSFDDMKHSFDDMKHSFDDMKQRFEFDFDLKTPLTYVPTLSAHLDALHETYAPKSNLRDLLDSFLKSEIVNDILNNEIIHDILGDPKVHEEGLDERVKRTLEKAEGGQKLVGYGDLPVEWKNNPFVKDGYRFIPLEKWHLIPLSLFKSHNETLNIHTHLIPFFILLLSLRSTQDTPETLYSIFALVCLFSSSLWHTMSGCAHLGSMEFCARVDYVGIGWLISASVGTVAHYGFETCGYDNLKRFFLGMCAATGAAGNVLPFMKWFNQYEYRIFRVLFFLSMAFSSLAPIVTLGATHTWGGMLAFIAPIVPSLVSYIIGLGLYVTHVPERWCTEKWRKWLDGFGGGSHALWHCFIVLAVSQHKAALQSLREGMPGICG